MDKLGRYFIALALALAPSTTLLGSNANSNTWSEYKKHDKEMRKEILNRVFSFAENHHYASPDTTPANLHFSLDIEKRNVLLLAVPDMFKFLKGKRNFHAQQHNKLSYPTETKVNLEKTWENSDFPSHSLNINGMAEFYYPHIYNEAVFGRDIILSPFRRCNKLYYKYDIIHSSSSTHVYFHPFQSHASLIDGMAEVDSLSGRIIQVQFSGSHELNHFQIKMVMDNCGNDSLTALDTDFRFLGNKINSKLSLTDTTSIHQSTSLSNGDEYSTSFLRTIGDVAWSSTRASSGRTSMKLSPVLNPFMMSYSQSKGLAYKLDFNLTHNIKENQQLKFDINLGYNFKQKQLYMNIPIQWYYNLSKEGSIIAELTRGDRMASSVLSAAIDEGWLVADSIDEEDINYFADSHVKLANTYLLARNLLSTVGVSYHRRYAVNAETFRELGLETRHDNFAPYINLTYRFPNQGPVLRFDYEQGIADILGSHNSFTRLELDAKYKHKLRSIRTLSLRAGMGIFLAPDDYAFMDYANFRDNNLPEGWNDDWTGEFQMLSSYQYNISKYYARGNVTYESPLLILYWLPFVGKYIETERLYFNALVARAMHPYIEIGYGLKNKLFSGALYANFNNFHYKGIEFKINVELFNH